MFKLDNGQYFLKIEYGSNVPSKDVDYELTDNELDLKGAEICNKIIQTYLAQYRNSLLALINTHRKNNQLQPLIIDSCLNEAAQNHSEWMKKTGNFSHIGENGSKHQARCIKVGCTCSGETIYSGSNAPSGAFNAWEKSPVHNSIMLGGYKNIGIGLKQGYITAVYQ